MRSCPAAPKIVSSSATSNFPAAATNASAACSGVSNAFGFADEVAAALLEDWGAAGMVSDIRIAAASPQAIHERRERFSFIDDEFMFFLSVIFDYLRPPPPPPRERPPPPPPPRPQPILEAPPE